MSIRKKVRRFGTLLAAALLAASTLVLPSSSQPAVAQDACTPSEPNVIPTWQALYDDRGITLCRGIFTDPPPLGIPAATVQIVDLEAGAKVRLLSEVNSSSDPFADNLLYNTRTASEWFDWIQSTNDHVDPGRLFSTTNASFFTDTSGGATMLSLPEMSTEDQGWYNFKSRSYGVAFADNENPAWDALKDGFRIGHVENTPQRVEFFHFPTHYDKNDVVNAFDMQLTEGPACGTGDRCVDAAVAFDPLYNIVPSARRTYIGLDASDRFYILTSRDSLTVIEAGDILESFGAQLEIQLDGGGSTQTYVEDHPAGSIPSVVGRAVPDVVAAYLAPE